MPVYFVIVSTEWVGFTVPVNRILQVIEGELENRDIVYKAHVYPRLTPGINIQMYYFFREVPNPFQSFNKGAL